LSIPLPREHPAPRSGLGLFCVLDHGYWLLIQLLPGPRLMVLARQRPWQHWQRALSPERQQLWKGRCIAWLLHSRSRRAGIGSTCLSSPQRQTAAQSDRHAQRAASGHGKFPDGRKVPHAWLRDPYSGRLFTPGLTPGAGAALTHF
jgi:hypothetical protein